jgi:hypothetical protein
MQQRLRPVVLRSTKVNIITCRCGAAAAIHPLVYFIHNYMHALTYMNSTGGSFVRVRYMLYPAAQPAVFLPPPYERSGVGF